jgi:hypothetical protein
MKLEEIPGPIIKWTEFPNPFDNGPVNGALLDYIEASIRAALADLAGGFSSTAAYEEYKTRMRKEFNERILQISGAK